MGAYLLKRLVAVVPVILLVSIAVFMLIHLVPGDPAQVIAGENQDPEVVASLRRQLGLDQPLHVQYLTWLAGTVHGDLGRSVRTNEPVTAIIANRLKPTLLLSALALSLSLSVALPLGVLAGTRRNSVVDVLATGLTLAGISMPNFLIGLMLIFFFAMRLGWLPTSGFIDPFSDPVAGLRSLALPTITLAIQSLAVVARTTRSSLLETLNQDYVRTARSKGLAEATVVRRHALRNALIPVVTIIGLQMGGLLAGAVITEFIFAIPGVGRLAVDSIFARDFPVIQGVVLTTAIGFIGCNLLADLTYAALDPRIRYN